MAVDTLDGGRIEPRELAEEMRTSYLDYAMSVIVGRALPDVRDGLKPVHQRVLFAMNEAGLQPNRPYSKCSRVVGDVLGKYHPHGDTAAYDALVRMAQWFSLRYPLVDGQGNFGNQDGYSAAAMRYTECRLSPLAVELLRDIDADTVDFRPNYDDRHREPTVLPSRFPNLLCNGSAGIAVGMATNIPPHNLRETIDAAIELIDNPEATTDDLMTHIKGPDFPTGGIVMGLAGIREAYETGRGRVIMRAKVHHEELKGGKNALIVTEVPYQVKRDGDDGVIKKIADLVNDKVISEISDINNHSDRTGTRITIELKRDAIPMVVLNKLYKHTALQSTFGVNMVALVDGVPRTLSLQGDAPALRRPPARGGHPAHQVRPRPRREARPHPRGLPEGARPPGRSDRADPRGAGCRDGASVADRPVRVQRGAGNRDPRAAPARADRPRAPAHQGRARRPARADRRAAGDPGRRGQAAGRDQGGAGGDPRSLRATTGAPRSSLPRARSTSSS